MESDEAKNALKKLAAILGAAVLLIAAVLAAGVFYVSQKYKSGPPKKTTPVVQKETPQAEQKEENFLLSWKEDGAELNLTAVSLGKISAPAGLWKIPGVSYAVGEEIHALVLDLKIKITDSFGATIPLNLKRLLNEAGEFQSPNTKGFVFPDSGGDFGRPNQIYENQKVIFVVPEGTKEFNITTGGKTNIFFTVTVQLDGTLKVAKELEVG